MLSAQKVRNLVVLYYQFLHLYDLTFFLAIQAVNMLLLNREATAQALSAPATRPNSPSSEPEPQGVAQEQDLANRLKGLLSLLFTIMDQ